MTRVAIAAMSLLAAPMPVAAIPASELPHTVIDKNCVVTRFYDVPLNLKLSDLNALGIDHTRAYHLGEGDYYPEATLLVDKNVLLQVEFSDEKEPEVYQMRTSSPGAMGPRGVAIGTTLKEVRAKWPEGKFYWATAHGNYVAFTNGTNVFFEFDPRDMPPAAFDNPPVPIQNAKGEWVVPQRAEVIPDDLKLKVTRIRITSGRDSQSCPNQNRKK